MAASTASWAATRLVAAGRKGPGFRAGPVLKRTLPGLAHRVPVMGGGT